MIPTAAQVQKKKKKKKKTTTTPYVLQYHQVSRVDVLEKVIVLPFDASTPNNSPESPV